MDVVILVEWEVLSGLAASADYTRKTLWSFGLFDFRFGLVLCHGGDGRVDQM